MLTDFTVATHDIKAWRRHIHAHPELSFKETQTCAYITEVLQGFGLEVEHPTPTSAVAVIEGEAEGPEDRCVAWRADIDALPVQEETGESFASLNDGVAHACGHDAHAAMALGIAHALCENRHAFSGRVKMIFQHAEELNPGGAIELVEAGVLDGVDAIYGIHVMNDKLHRLSVHKGPASTIAGGTFLTIRGKGAHGSMPHTGIDPAVCASFIANALYTVPARNTDPQQMAVMNVGMIQTGAAPNVVPEEAKLGISMRSVDDATFEIMQTRATEIIDHFAAAFRCEAEYSWVPTYPVVVNDSNLCEVAYEAAREVIGENATWGEGTTASEDFSRYTKVIPGCFLFLGAGDAENGLTFSNHNPQFTIVEDCLETGVRAGVAILTSFLDRA